MFLRVGVLGLVVSALVGGQLIAMQGEPGATATATSFDRSDIIALCDDACAEEGAKHATHLRLLERSDKIARESVGKKHRRAKSSVGDLAVMDKVAMQMSKAVDAVFKRKIELISEIKETAASIEDARVRLAELQFLEATLHAAVLSPDEDTKVADEEA